MTNGLNDGSFRITTSGKPELELKDIRMALFDQTEGPSSPALCSHSGQPAVGQEPTKQDMVQQHPPTHVPQQQLGKFDL